MRLEMPAAEVATARFGVSPMFELAALLRRLRRGARGALAAEVWRGWRQRVELLRADPDASWVLALAGDQAASLVWLPGTPSMGRSFDEDLLALQDTPDDHLGELSAVRGRLATGLRTAWDALLRDQRPAVRSIAEHEISRTTTVLREHGWSGVFATVCEGLSWDGRALELAAFTADDDLDQRSTTLVLMPSVFAIGPVVRRGTTDPSVVIFPARGIGNLFSRDATAPSRLAPLLGANRVRLMLILNTPTTVSQLRELTDLSLGSISRHLAVLVDAKLATSRRIGRAVEYELTDLGRALIAAHPGESA